MKRVCALLALAESVEDAAFYAMLSPDESIASLAAREEQTLRSQD
jgi:hypothetical protein